jgi:hypothetical protein
VVYVVAAYTLTIGVLVLYGVLLQHRARIARSRLVAADGRSAIEDPSFARGFNLGAALLPPFWALAHGLAAAGLGYFVALLALGAVVAFGSPAMRIPTGLLASLLIGGALFFGAIGNRVVAAEARKASDGRSGDAVAVATRELRWAVAGAVLHTVLLPWACYFWLGAA